ncbi:MAG: DUF502 domain-containing protein [Anaeromyxobacteraceae bacterium]
MIDHEEPAAPSRPGVRTYLVTGLLVWVPLLVTWFVLKVFVDLVDSVLLLLPQSWRPEAVLGFPIPGLGIIVTGLVLLGTGALLANLVGRSLVAGAEGLLARVPFVGPIYRGSKQLAETVLSPSSKSFREVVLVPFPHPGARAIAFVTGAELAEVRARTGQDLVSVFVPTTPNPTSGFVFMVPRADVVPLEMTVDEAFRLVVSLGVVTPAWPRKAAPGQLPAAP